MKTLVILPTQIFSLKFINKKCKIVIWEHPHYFKSYNFNKKKLILHFATMKYYFELLKKKKYNVKYIKYNEKFNVNNYVIYDPVDKIKLPNKYELVDTPYFLLKKEDMEKYRKKSKNFRFNNFYIFSKKLLNIIPNLKSQDKNNRKKMPKNTDVPDLPSNKLDVRFINYAKKRVEKEFKKNYGNIDNFIYPISHVTAKKFLSDFIKKRFNNFGKYQDYIDKEENYLFHSILSSSINIGLITPFEIIKEISKYKSKIPVNSYEGFIRQLFWREYQRYCYIYYNFKNKNYFGNNKKLTKKWYTGNVGNSVIDHTIKKGFDTAYLHHIERLMVIGNYMNLFGIKPIDGFKWFMEFSIDSYEWVMHQNVLEMVFCISGGDTMTKPYISSSNYILKMSNYKKGEWSEDFDNIFRKFVKKNKQKLMKFRYFFPFLSKY